MTIIMNNYIYEYDGKELRVMCQVKLPKEKHLETAKTLVMNEYGGCDESKLVFKKLTTTQGYIDDDRFIEKK